jgi:cytochrome P450
MTDDVYKGYFIPEGALVIANVWYASEGFVSCIGHILTEQRRKFLHDPEVYADPFDFNPDRFLGPNPAPHPTDVGVFGFGRR